MSDETILSGYCRVLDQSRMVTVEWEGQSLLGRRLLLRRLRPPNHL